MAGRPADVKEPDTYDDPPRTYTVERLRQIKADHLTFDT